MKEIDLCVYFPFDFIMSVRALLNRLNPCCVIIMETEIWPNFTHETARRDIPLIMANGRISDRSFPRYLKLHRFFRRPLQNFTLFCMQSAIARERIIAIAAPADKVAVCGNLKYDIPFQKISTHEIRELRRRRSIPDDCLVITAGSTHEGEEEMLITVYRDLLSVFTNLFLVLVPRHPQRSREVAVLLQRNGLRYRLLTELKPESTAVFQSGDVLLVDSVGELMNLYALADIAFVGGSLVPVGGHNLLEPVSRGVATLFGPNMANFRDIAALVLESRAGAQVNTPAELAEALRRLIDDSAERQRVGNNGLEMMRTNGGATGKHMQCIVSQLTD